VAANVSRCCCSKVVAMVQQEALVPGFALAWGTSNWQPSRIAALMEACQHLGVPPPCADAPQASLAAPVRAVWPGTTCCTREHAALHAREKLALFGWAPLAAGYLTDRGVSDGGGGGGGDGPFATAANAARRHRAAAWGASRGLSLAQVGVAFGVQRFADAFPAFVVLGTSDAAHLAELAAATQVRLTRADVRHLYDGSPLAE
jgi:aryl-alcohol dehydrogenase-like predicted oxidoreductase